MILSWDNYFMGIARISALRSKDPKAQVGACIVNKDNKIIGVGYNGLPKGMEDTDELWNSEIKLKYVVHAEVNALLNATKDLSNSTIYVTKFPCNECTKLLIQAGIKRVVFLENTESEKWNSKEAKYMFQQAKVELIPCKAIPLNIN